MRIKAVAILIETVCRRSSHQLIAMLVALATLFTGSSACADELVTLNARPGVSLSMLIWKPLQSKPETVVLLIPGGDGDIGLGWQNGRAKAQAPYLYSTKRQALLQGKVAVAVIDRPSDQEDMTQKFRTSPQHLADMQAVLQELQRRYPGARLVLMAHSRGTVSAGQILQHLGDKVSAAVFFSGLYRASGPDAPAAAAGPGLSQLDWAQLKVPVLLVHHSKDSCPLAPFAAAASTHVPLIELKGAADADRVSGCGNPASNHWLAGKENAVGREVFNWLAGTAWKPVVQ
ncbi:alpha/beta hydrolase [Pseudoduganella danionis]|uniref:alpha/beta hydrolase n=1 Tax=Pseudoduganella danionis TaxID=1890295 RepID=UPI0035B17DFC